MDAVESPLDVLSRAATMLQESQQQEDAVGKSAKQLPTAKWKRDRRSRPDYMRKLDPKNGADSHDSSNGVNGGTDKSSSSSSASASASPASPTSSVITNFTSCTKSSEKANGDAPLDMTTSPRQRGLPPSYSQAISDPSFRSNYTNNRSNRDDIPTGISMCDPIIDEHFRRSLGKDYNTVFNNNAKENPLNKIKTPVPRSSPPPIVEANSPEVAVEAPKRKSSPTTTLSTLPPTPITTPTTPTPVTNVIEMMDSSGLSVDDHFAKALGDTWHKLNKKDSNSSDNTVTSSAPEVIST